MIKNLRVKNFVLIGVGIFLVAGVSGCASYDIERCQGITIENEAERDFRILGRDRFDSYQEGCREFGITFDRERYAQAFEQQRLEYCTYRNGFDLGRENKTYHNVCKDEEVDFFKGFADGNKIYHLEQANKSKQEEDS